LARRSRAGFASKVEQAFKPGVAGGFRECFAGGRFTHRWRHRQIDSRSVAATARELVRDPTAPW
jgi:hypothetical protein